MFPASSDDAHDVDNKKVQDIDVKQKCVGSEEQEGIAVKMMA
jgi:hypothetical protein